MTLVQFVATMRTNWTLLVIFTAGGLMAAAVASMLTPTTYSARTELYVSAAPASPESHRETLSALQAATSFARVAKSATVLGAVIDELGLTESVEELGASVTATSEAGTALLTIGAEHSSPQRAAAIANSVADGTTRLAHRLERASLNDSRFTISAVTRATAPTRSTGPELWPLLGLGALLGLGTGTLTAVARSALAAPAGAATAASAAVAAASRPSR
jgi:capsular polysaccharide biosynthesis protein